MSHIVSIQTKVRDQSAIEAACRRLELSPPVQATAQLYSGAATGVVVQLPGWHYPVVFNERTGEAQYDNFLGRWGDGVHLDHFLQIYAVERAKIEARKNGYAVTEQALEDGSIRLQILTS